MNNKLKLVFTRNELIYILIATLLFFQIYIQNSVFFFKFFDEFIALCAGAFIIKSLFLKKVMKSCFRMIVLIILISAIGLIGNMHANIQKGISPILTDMLNVFKVFIVYIAASIYVLKINTKRTLCCLAFIMRLFVMCAFICMLLHFFTGLNFGKEVRYGLISYMFINKNPGQLSVMFYSIILILAAELKYNSNFSPRGNMIFIIMALIVWASTLRTRAFIYCLVYIYLYYYMILKKGKFKLNLGNGLIITLITFLIGYEQYETYFLNDRSARAIFMKYGIKTLNTFFPLGSGFGTYGTDVAAKYYSKLYVQYGFQNVYGLSPDNLSFSHDTYWSAILAQFGFLGTILFVLLIFSWAKNICLRTQRNKYSQFIGIFIIFALITSSLASATFFNFVIVGTFFLIPLIFDSKNKEDYGENRNIDISQGI